jgi:hypothetical protein
LPFECLGFRKTKLKVGKKGSKSMSELTKTMVFVVVAAALATTVYFTRPSTSRDVGQFAEERVPFFPDVKPEAIQGLEITAFNKDRGEVETFAVKKDADVWVIPSHNNYPADADARLRKTAGALIGLMKDTVAGNSKDMHAEFGVVDPAEAGVDPKATGTRIKLTDASGNVSCDLIVGKEVPEKTEFRFVRLPGTDRVYQTKAGDLGLTTRFADWINTDLITDSSFDFDRIRIDDYKIEERGNRARKVNAGVVNLMKDDKGKWKLEDLKEGEEVDETKVSNLASAISDVSILGVRPKPPGLTADLNFLEAQFAAESMISRGFYPTEDGAVVSGNGEVTATTGEGIKYTLRFGREFVGQGDEVEKGGQDDKLAAPAAGEPAKEGTESPADEKKVQENRFLLVSVTFDESRFPPIEPPADMTPAPAPEAAPEGTPTPAAPAESPVPPTAPTPEAAPPAEAKPEPAPAEPAKEPGGVENVGYQEAEPANEPAPAADETAPPVQAPADPAPAADAPPIDPEAAKKAEEEAKKAAEEQAKAMAEAAKRDYEQRVKERERKIEAGKKKAKDLEARYGQWFYVVSNESATKIRLNRAAFIKVPEKKEGDAAAPAVENAPVPASPPEAASPPAESPKEPGTEAPQEPGAESPKDAAQEPAPEAKVPPATEAPKESTAETPK